MAIEDNLVGERWSKSERKKEKFKWDGRNSEEERKEEEIGGDSHSVLTEKRRRRGRLIKRYWILVTLHSISWQPCRCAVS